MLKYLIVILKDYTFPICHYNVVNKGDGLMSLSNLKRAIIFGLKHNLLFQFILPCDVLPEEYYKVMSEVENVIYIPCPEEETGIKGCIRILDKNDQRRKILLVPISLIGPLVTVESKLKDLLQRGYQISVIHKDVESATSHDLERYDIFLKHMVAFLAKLNIVKNNSPFNIITDRLYLNTMNNCNAGVSTITFAPDGRFYLCPAFYYDAGSPLVVNDYGVEILNQYLLKIENAPICSNCDAFQCHRCVYLNQKGTHEINTPTRNQCIISHLERNASRLLASQIEWINEEEQIPQIEYLDPFEKIIRK